MNTGKSMTPSPATILKQTFGYDTFRPLQREVIENVLNKHDSLAIMPTGGGKSLCYQIPALIFEGLTVVVSPLIALMKDQVEQMRAAGVPALFLNSTLSPEAYQQNMEYVRRGETKLLYVAPETLLTPRIFDLLANIKVDCFTIDEAHCISEWGHDFRPEYRQLVDVRRRFPSAVCLALTATATPRVRADIKASLGFNSSNEFVASFNRKNLYIEVKPKSDPTIQTIHFLKRFKDQSGIIYCFSRKQVDDLTASLTRKGYSVCAYHAGLEDEQRRRNQEAFIRDDIQIIVATIAFGMGINKPNVRFVIHYDLPKSVESYYQEIGRAGRDGLSAHCLLLYSYGDVAKLKYFIDQKEGEERRVASQHLDAMVRYAEDQVACRRQPLLAYFGETYTVQNCKNCDNCNAEPPILTDITIPAQKFLSCVKRTGERFGAGHVVDVLLGSKKEKVLKFEHEKLSTYDIGQELNQKQWMHLARQLAQMGYLNQDGEFHTLSLTSKALETLRNRSKIMGQLQEVEERAPQKANKAELEYNHALFAILRSKRKEIADAAGVPPYVIFSDRTLVELAAFTPQTSEKLLAINGIGLVKARQFGDAFLELIRDYCIKRGIKEKERDIPDEKSTEARTKNKNNGSNLRYIVVGEAFNAGENLQELTDRFSVTKSTIINYLVKYSLDGNVINSIEELQSLVGSTPLMQKAVFDTFSEVGTEYLKPAFDKLNGAIDYDELKILRLLYISNHPN
jgi:ATP-dependent DNA helicase RecQ